MGVMNLLPGMQELFPFQANLPRRSQSWSKCTLRQGWVFLERTQILSGIQFTTYFIEILVVETKRYVGSFVNVILTRQTCGQHSSRAAESKRRALGNYVSEHLLYVPDVKM